MRVAGKRAKAAVNNFMKEFPDYKIEHIIADLELDLPRVKGTLRVKIKPS